MQGGGAVSGPRLLGRLTAELIHRSPQYMSCISNYEIDLRGEGCGTGQRRVVLVGARSSVRCRCAALCIDRRLQRCSRERAAIAALHNNNNNRKQDRRYRKPGCDRGGCGLCRQMRSGHGRQLVARRVAAMMPPSARSHLINQTALIAASPLTTRPTESV